MTLQLRPTFSESWYRVANLRAKLRSSAQISRQFYRGERWYVVRDPAGNQFHRLSDAAYRFVGLLDGTRTVAEAWDLAGGQLADDAPTQPEVIQILSHLYSANLIDSDVTPDSAVLLRRHKKQQQRKMQGRLMNVLFPRIPLWDPDQFLKRWMPLVKIGFSKIGAIVWLLVVVGAVAALAPHWDRIKLATTNSISPGNWLWLWGVFVFVKLIHELGHAFACRRWGGECHELGIMFLVLIPTPYVDASTAWSFPSKWKRMFVGMAGMIVELFFAALCTFAWLAIDNQSSLISQLLFNAMLVAGVSTVIFNANPLLRYDGYYILSDYLEIPNLRQKSTEYTFGLIKRHIFRVKAHQPLPPPLQRIWLFTYCVTSGVYRIFVGFAIIILLTYQLPEQAKIIGVLMGLGAVVTFLLVPVFKTFKYLAIEPELHRKRGRATAFTVAVAAAVIVLIGAIPFWVNIDAAAVVEPAEGYKQTLYTGEDGFVREIKVKDGQWLKKGDVILVAQNDKLDADINATRANLERYQAMVQQAIGNPTQRRYNEITVRVVQERLKLLEDQREKLTIRAPIEGELVAPQLRDLQGRFLPRGEELAIVQRKDKLAARVLLTQEDVEPVIGENDTVPRTEIRMVSDVDTFLPAESVRILPAAPENAPHAALTQAGGEDLAPDPRDPSGTKLQQKQFEVVVTVDNPEKRYEPGQKAYVRFKLEKRPLIWQWGRRFWQLIQTNSTGNNA